MTADGLATAGMVLGEKEGRRMFEQLKDVEAFLIYDDNGKLAYWQSDGFGAKRVH